MKKFFLIISFSLLSILAFGQKIEKDVVDDFTGERVIKTTLERINVGNAITSKGFLYFFIAYDKYGPVIQFQLLTGDEVFSVNEGDKLLFKMKSGKIIEFNSLADNDVTIGGGGKANNAAINGITLQYGGDFSIFKTDDYVEKIRFENSNRPFDITLKQKNAEKINNAYQLILEKLVN